MSNPNSQTQPRPLLAMSFLLLTFASGLLLVYLADVAQPAAAVPCHEGSFGSMVACATESVAAITDSRSPTGDDGDQSAAETLALRDLLTAMQQRIQSLEHEMEAIKKEQGTAFDVERQRLNEDLTAIASARQRQLAEAEEVVRRKAESLTQLKSDYAELNAQFTANGILVSLAESDLKFPRGEARLVSAEPQSLKRVSEFLDRHPSLQLLLRGHTDGLGDESRNLVLSEQRAIAVRDALVVLGVAQGRIRTEGFGETKPIADNRTEEGRLRNRRVELYLTEP